ncbi:hypothetical protein GCM10009839_32970 [Catenulispora yoronensis]|uniref:Uncharacterized protein n=1 Tax=Catenulispora yoronensis TaxID=450799 RepID=A0ABN2U7Q5_9ACTN
MRRLESFDIVRDRATSRRCRGTFVFTAVDASASRMGRITLKIFDERIVFVLVAMLIVAALLTSLALAAGSTWPTALLAGGGGAWGVLSTLPSILR